MPICCMLVGTRGIAAGGARGAMPPPTSIFEPNKVQQFQFQTSGDNAFYGCSEIIRTKNFAIFTKYATIFEQFTVPFHFF